MKRLALGIVAVLASCSTSVFAGTITPVVTYSSPLMGSESRPFTLGYQFTTSIPFQVNGLGYFADGTDYSHEVGIWGDDGSLLVSTEVSREGTIQDFYMWADVSYTLLPGTYVIGGQAYEDGNAYSLPLWGALGISTQPGYTWVTELFTYGEGLNEPSLSFKGAYGNNGILAVDFSAEPLSPVPEPGTLLLLATGLLSAMGAVGRKFSS